MDRIFSKGTLLVFSILLLVVFICWLMRGCSGDATIRASVSKREVVVDEPFNYVDSTPGVKEVVWEFGNGDFSDERRGTYTFHTVGNYKVRVKADSKTQTFVVKVLSKGKEASRKFVRIIAPTHVLKNEGVTFIGEGDAEDWRWEFGETGKVDSREQNAIYHYSEVGDYVVRLTAGNMEYPVFHTIHVAPEVVGRITEDPVGMGDMDIQKHLQAIIDHPGEYNKNYNYILKKYLKTNVLVVVNNVNENDFTSYCYGLKIMGKQNSTVIESVALEKENGKVKRLLVNQKTAN